MSSAHPLTPGAMAFRLVRGFGSTCLISVPANVAWQVLIRHNVLTTTLVNEIAAGAIVYLVVDHACDAALTELFSMMESPWVFPHDSELSLPPLLLELSRVDTQQHTSQVLQSIRQFWFWMLPSPVDSVSAAWFSLSPNLHHGSDQLVSVVLPMGLKGCEDLQNAIYRSE